MNNSNNQQSLQLLIFIKALHSFTLLSSIRDWKTVIICALCHNKKIIFLLQETNFLPIDDRWVQHSLNNFIYLGFHDAHNRFDFVYADCDIY